MFGAPKKAPPNPKDLIKQNKRQVTKSQHEIQREIYALERQEKQTLLEIKKLAAKNQNSTVRVLAKQVVTIRAQKERLQKSHAQLNGLKTAGSTMAANLAVSQAMSGTARVLSVVNASNSMESLQASMMDMQKSMAMSEMQEDMLDELLLGSDSDEEEETEDVLAQVFDEIGLDLRSDLVDAPTRATTSALRGAQSASASPSTSRSAARPSSSFLNKSSSTEEFKPLTAQEEAEAEQLLAELGV